MLRFNPTAWVFLFVTMAMILTVPLITMGDSDTLKDFYGRSINGRDVRLAPATGSSNSDISGSAASNLFEPYVVYAAGDSDEAVGIGDLNHDGRGDVAISEGAYGDGLRVLLQNISGTLNPATLYPSGNRLESLAVGDLDNDGRDDVVMGNFSDDTVRVFYQNVGGTLGPEEVHLVGKGPDALAVADITGDDLMDVAISHWNDPFIGVLPQQIDGKLGPMVDYPSPQAGWDDIDTGDVNGDGLTDVVKMNGQGLNPDFSIYLQQLNGTLADPIPFYNPVSDWTPGGIAVGDVTGDGLDDVVLAYGGNTPSSGIAVFAQNADGDLIFTASYPAYDIPEPVEISDVNLDGRKDVIVLHGGWNAMGVFLQNLDGSLAPYELYSVPYASHYGPQGLDVGDINGDSVPDVVIADYNHGLVVLYNSTPSEPVLDIKANDSDEPVELTLGETLSVTIELDPGMYRGVQADWWCVADTPLGWYYYNHSDSTACLYNWLRGFIVSYQGPLGAVSPPFKVLKTSDLQLGSYTFYFGVDLCRNGKLNKKYLYYDSVEVNITP